MEHLIHPVLLQKQVEIHVVGAGGNGAQMVPCLARLDIAMRALGHEYGLNVKLFDAKRVSEANPGRQVFSVADIGQYKAAVIMHRTNHFFGLNWCGYPVAYEAYRGSDGSGTTMPDIVISCVDTRGARRNLHQMLFDGRRNYWLDLGNTEDSGNVILGEPGGGFEERPGSSPRLPCVTELFPNLLDDTKPELDTPSCNVRMSLATQGLFVNDLVVRYGAQLLYDLFGRGRIATHGVMFSTDSKRSAPIPVDPKTWARFGYATADTLQESIG
jgi:PRTRC genetic system ThiF family protein